MSGSGSRLATSARSRRWLAMAAAAFGAAAPVAFALHAAFEGWVWLAMGTAFAVAVMLGLGVLILSFAYELVQRVKQLESEAGHSRAHLVEVGDDLAYQRSRTSEIDARIVGMGAEMERSFEAAQHLAAATEARVAHVEVVAAATTDEVARTADQVARTADQVARTADHVTRAAASIGAVAERLPRVEEAVRKDIAAVRAGVAQHEKLARDLDRSAGKVANALWRQTEGLVALYTTLQPPKPLPPMRGWAMSPDILSFIVSQVLVQDRSSVLELGSGVSTLLMALAMERKGSGSVVSLDHDEVYGAQTASLLESFGLSHRAEVRIAPLTDVELGGETWRWYDTAQIPDVEVDLLTIDGPPWVEGMLARYPALPVVHDLLAPGAVVVLDDARRDAEQETAERWRAEFPDVSFRVVDHEKGTLVGERVARA